MATSKAKEKGPASPFAFSSHTLFTFLWNVSGGFTKQKIHYISKTTFLSLNTLFGLIYLFKWSCPHKRKRQPFQFPQITLIRRPLWANHSDFFTFIYCTLPLFFCWCRCHITDTMYKTGNNSPQNKMIIFRLERVKSSNKLF